MSYMLALIQYCYYNLMVGNPAHIVSSLMYILPYVTVTMNCSLNKNGYIKQVMLLWFVLLKPL